jgi:hypothetical protein
MLLRRVDPKWPCGVSGKHLIKSLQNGLAFEPLLCIKTFSKLCQYPLFWIGVQPQVLRMLYTGSQSFLRLLQQCRCRCHNIQYLGQYI